MRGWVYEEQLNHNHVGCIGMNGDDIAKKKKSFYTSSNIKSDFHHGLAEYLMVII